MPQSLPPRQRARITEWVAYLVVDLTDPDNGHLVSEHNARQLTNCLCIGQSLKSRVRLSDLSVKLSARNHSVQTVDSNQVHIAAAHECFDNLPQVF